MAENTIPKARAHVFETLDGMRGIAAICVAVMHAQVLLGVFPHSGFLAVDFFFVLSGFVISYAYEDRLQHGLSPGRFTLIRLIRLYPLYILGVILAHSARFVGGVLHMGPAPTPTQYLIWPGLEALFLPVPAMFHPEAGHYFPGLFPAWSLFFELVVNIGYGFFARYLTDRRLIAILILTSIYLVVEIIAFGGVDHGGRTTDGAFGLARVLYPFFAGIGLKRLYFSGKINLKVYPWLSAPILLGLLCMPDNGPYLVAFHIACVILIFPALVLIFAFARAQGWQRTALLQLGKLSYPIYILHAPVFVVISRLATHFHIVSGGKLLLVQLLYLATVLFGSALAGSFYDIPIRKALSRKLLGNSPARA